MDQLIQVQAPTQLPPYGGVAGVAGAAASSQLGSTSLYVGDLEPNVDEAQLYEMFKQAGPVVSIRVCRDLLTKRSLGYAYVNYNTAQDATHAMELLNFTPVSGKEVRIMYSQRDPTGRKSGAANVFIKNLDKKIDNKALFDTFTKIGPILSCKVATDAAGQSKGYGFVQFEHEEAAKAAVERVNGMLLHDKQVFVGPFVRRAEREHSDGLTRSSKFNNVYVKNIAETITVEDLKKAFREFGVISSAIVIEDADGKSKCFGFVNFEHADDAARAVEMLNGKKFDEKEWYVGRAQKKSEREAELKSRFEQVRKERITKNGGANLYLKNLDDTVDDNKLKQLFAAFGTISSSKVMRHSQGQSMGCGFVAFSTPEEASRAMTEMNGRMVGAKPLYVALAQRKEERRAWLQSQYAHTRSTLGVGMASPSSVPMYHPGHPAVGQQIFYGQPPHALITTQSPGYGPQQQILAGARPGAGSVPNYFVPVQTLQPMRQVQQGGQRAGGRGYGGGAPVQQQQRAPVQQQQSAAAQQNQQAGQHQQNQQATIQHHQQAGQHQQNQQAAIQHHQQAGQQQQQQAATQHHQQAGQHQQQATQHQQQTHPRGGNRNLRFNQNAKNTPTDGSRPTKGSNSGMLPARLDAGQSISVPTPVPTSDGGLHQPLSIGFLASQLRTATPENQRTILGEQIYPLVEKLERHQAGKVTGMLLEMDHPEVLHLIESPEDLKAKVAEAMQVLRDSQEAVSVSNQFAGHSGISSTEVAAA